MGVTCKKTLTKTRRRLRDVDQVIADLKSPKHLAQYKATKANEDLPGLGQFYCVECAKWFESENSMVTHRKGKTHKRRFVIDVSSHFYRVLTVIDSRISRLDHIHKKRLKQQQG